MKTKINTLILSVIGVAILPFVFASCDDDDKDTTPPTIKLVAPEEGAILKIGSDIHFDLELSDNEMLLSYKVEIHNAFDGHGHKSSAKAEDGTVAFAFQKSWNIAGNRNIKIHHHEIVIPENATPGNYHLMIFCTDAARNEAYIARNIVLSHDGEELNHDNE